MRMKYSTLLKSPVGTIFKAVGGGSGITYYGEMGEDMIIILSCPRKGYTSRRFRPTSISITNIEIPNNYKEKNKVLKIIGREDEN